MKNTIIIGLIFSFLLTSSSIAYDYPLKPAPVGSVKVEGGFWGPRITTNAAVTVQHNFKFLEKTSRLAIFDVAAGVTPKSSGNDSYVVDSDVFKIIEGAAYSLQTRPANINEKYLARQVERIIAAQQEDGFLCPRITLNNQASYWDDLRKSHVLYSAGHLFEAAVAYHQATGKNNLLNSSTRFADLIDSHFGPGKVHDTPGHQEIELALVRLYRTTGDRRYLNLSKFFLDQRGFVHGPKKRVPGIKPRSADYNQDRMPLIKAQQAVGHAVRAGYTYAAMADIAALFNDQEYQRALDRLWKDVTDTKIYITGASATAQYYDEGFGDPYCLPNETAYCETCGTIAQVLWSHRMGLLHADSSYFDVLERALYNGVLSGISLSGDRFFYKNPLSSRGHVRRDESWNPACCQSNLVRIIPQVGSIAYATQPDSIYVNLFVAGKAKLKLNGQDVCINQKTDYPRTGKITITVEDTIEKPFTIALRIPGWAIERPVPGNLYRFAAKCAQHPTLTIAGKPVELDKKIIDKGYAQLTRTWNKGDSIDLDIPMPVRRVLANKNVKANRNRVALQRGPLVYCIEAVDNDGIRTDSIILPDETKLSSHHRNDILNDVVIITGDAKVAYEPKWGKPVKVREHKIIAIPYYAWANRQDGYMDIWLARSKSHAEPLPAPTAGEESAVTSLLERPARELTALTDRRCGPTSNYRFTPRLILPEHKWATQWIQYEWTKPRQLRSTAIYWAIDQRKQVYWGQRIRGDNLKLPKSWRLLYKDGPKWIPVETKDPFTLKMDRLNEVRFKPIKTTAVRLEVICGEMQCGIQEWLVD